MGYLDGFGVTLKQMFERPGHQRVPRREAAEARPLPRPPRPQPLRGRHGEVHRLRAVRRRVPGPLHLRPGRRQPARRRRCRPASATASSTRSTTCAASTATCAWRPAPPRPSPSRSCSSSPSPTARTPSTPRTSCWSTTTASPRSCRGRTGGEGDEEHTSAWVRATAPVGRRRLTRARSPGRASSASASAPPRRARPPTAPTARRRRSPASAESPKTAERPRRAALMDWVVFVVAGAGHPGRGRWA